MTIPTQQSLSGFIATDPQLSYTSRNDARFSARVGVRHGQRLDDGTFEELPPSFHSLTIFGRSAERAYEQMKKGDSFVASGRVREYTFDGENGPQQGEEFVANRVGHDTGRTRYEVDRSPRPVADEPAVAQATEVDAAEHPEPGREPAPDDPEPVPAAQRNDPPLAPARPKRSSRAQKTADIPF